MPEASRAAAPRGASRSPSGAGASSASDLFLALDFGTRRIGVAVGNRLLGTARALTTVRAAGRVAQMDAIAALIAQWQPDALVLGVPFHPDGAEHDNTRAARAFGRRLRARFAVPVHEVDERYSTTEALAAGATDADAAAAAIILEQYLRQTG